MPGPACAGSTAHARRPATEPQPLDYTFDDDTRIALDDTARRQTAERSA